MLLWSPMKYLILAVCGFLFWNCGGKEEEPCVFIPDVYPEDIDIRLEHFEDSIADIKTKGDLISLLSREPIIRDEMLRRREYPSDSAFIDEMFKRFTNPGIRELLAAKRFSNETSTGEFNLFSTVRSTPSQSAVAKGPRQSNHSAVSNHSQNSRASS